MLEGLNGELLSDAALSAIWDAADGAPASLRFGPVTLIVAGARPSAEELVRVANILVKAADDKAQEMSVELEFTPAGLKIGKALGWARL